MKMKVFYMEQKEIFYPTDQMGKSDFKLFRRLIYAEAGINLTEKKITLLSNRIRKRLKALNISSYHKYYMYLKKSFNKEIEIIKMIDAVTTNVTHFFRNPQQFEKFKNIILPDLINKNIKRKSIKILSAGCSTGEEPYTISIILLEYFKDDLSDWHLEVDGVDICTDALDRARAGIYNKEKMKEVKNKILDKYFIKTDKNTYQINKKVKSITRLNRFNLTSDNFTSKYDVLFCRNVVIYFDSETKEKIYRKFYDALQNNGYFLVGHSEGVFNDSRFKYIKPGIYRRN